MPAVLFLPKMRRIPNFYAVCVRRDSMLAFPDIVYDCHHHVWYVRSIVAYSQRSKLTGIERSVPKTTDAFASSSSFHGLASLPFPL
jgi:hypothetical protein